MILITCALKYEAKPLIKALKLQHIGEIKEYKIYQNKETYLIITGVGKIKAAGAIGFFTGKFQKADTIVNFGICGSSTKEFCIGELIHITSVKDVGSQREFFLQEEEFSNYKKSPLHTYEIPVTEKITQPLCVDMESSGICQLSFVSLPKLYIFKIVSDYLDNTHIKPAFLEGLIEKNLGNFLEILEELK